MAAFVKTVVPSLATKLPCDAHRSHNLFAGEAIAAGDACYIAASGLVFRSTGAAATAPAKVDGFAQMAYTTGMPVTLYHYVHIAYGPSTAVPGTRLFLSGTTAGGLDTVASAGGTAPIAIVDYIATDETPPHAVIFAMKSTY